MWACNCLNIVIKTESNDFQKVNSESLKLNEDEKKDNFFKQDIQQVGKLININKVHSGLVHFRNVGSWTIFYCVNCDVHSHAVHREKGASCVLINSNLLPAESIASIKASELFSTVFNIVVNPNDIEIDDNLVDLYLPSEVGPTVKSIRQVMTDVLRKESLAVEGKVKKFKEEQYDNLNNLRDRAFKEQQALVKVILNSFEPSKKPDSTNKNMTLPGSPGVPTRLNEPLLSSNLASNLSSPLGEGNSRHSPKRQKSSSSGLTASSFDAEGLFEFDGFEDEDVPTDKFEIDSDNEGDLNKEEGVSIPRNRTGSINVAKSLPMNIPAFMSQNHSREDLDDDLPPQSEFDMAASIKALAKSVHGDTVFGDLPRPRFSTQI